MPLRQIRCKLVAFGRILVRAVMIRYLLRLAAYLSTVFTSAGREFGGLEMGESGFYLTKFLTVTMFSSIILVRGVPGRLEGETSPEAINLLITLEMA